MRVLVTGATGFLGGVVARELRAEGHEVRGLGRDVARGAALERAGVAFVPADLRAADWAGLLRGVDAVVHAAARATLWGRWADFEADNIRPSGELARACAAAGVRLVHVSTPSVYNATGQTQAVREDTPVGPRFDSLYARSKFEAEEAVRAALPDATILRPRGLYGVGDTSLVPRLAHALQSGRLPRLTRDEVWTELTQVRNAAHAVSLALTRPAPGVYNVTDGQPIPLWATVDRLADALGAPRPGRVVPARLLEGAASLLELGARWHPAQPEPPLTASGVRLLTRPMTLDLTRACERLGYAPVVAPDDGLAEVFAHIRGQR
ncbi:NAD-dependent epimerase/dehydratase family protein [Deinococcus multiflagellatus]|uniref:NAD-dependent epimerase/dehydratase family protein n=1 Tax=Deinococcus multiflagellatus TaxID=1656887 RepID=A0ABW1ZHZ7_9DEIO|nr:NAD-dependent epimerase/dehydratase family protein [Deinococcus multiflagellatus]MBZ9713092.1 NAD-dependent epimerase/dehydratase family protein [Deinococcus multiflagellatus]